MPINKRLRASGHPSGSDSLVSKPGSLDGYGHADFSFTMKTYVHARPEDMAAARDALARKINRE